MKLDDFLKIKKVRCVNGIARITTGKVYDVIGLDKTCVHVTDDDGKEEHYWHCRFEPVLDTAENRLQGAELTPELEAVEPRFKVGDKVYRGLKGEIRTVERVEIKSLHFAEGGCDFIKHCCHATQENYERLQATFTDIKFEQPHKELMGSDLARALIKKGWVGFNCLCGNSGDDHVITQTIVTGVNNSGQFTTIDGKLFNNAIPVIGLRALEAREVGL